MSDYMIDCEAVTIGAGCLLRALLLPALRDIGWRVVVGQPRGDDFVKLFYSQGGTYKYEIVDHEGNVEEDVVDNVVGALSLGQEDSCEEFFELPSRMPSSLRMIAIGVTEVGLKPNSAPINVLGVIRFLRLVLSSYQA